MKRLIKLFLQSLSSSQANKEFAKLAELEKAVGYKFQNSATVTAALTHTSLSQGSNDSSPFERMEFLGDSVLGLIVAEELFLKFPKYSEGDLSKLKSKLVSRKFLALKSVEITLSEFILLSKEAIHTGGKESSSILADAMESLICAIYMDGGLEAARKFIKKFILKGYEKHLQIQDLTNYKSLLQEHTQSKFQKVPMYKVISEEGPDHEKIFVVEVFINNELLGSGKGPNKKSAQQSAAKEACKALNL